MVRIYTTDRALPLLELMRVKTKRALRQGNDYVPEGAVGTIVYVYEDGRAFEVEFTDPPSLVLTANRADLEHV